MQLKPYRFRPFRRSLRLRGWDLSNGDLIASLDILHGSKFRIELGGCEAPDSIRVAAVIAAGDKGTPRNSEAALGTLQRMRPGRS